MIEPVRTWWRDTAGGLPAVYWYLWAGLLINRMGAFAILFLSLYLTDQRDAGPALAGLVVGTYGLGGVAGTLLGGVLTDRLGRRPVLIGSHVVAAACLAALAIAGHLGLIAVLCALLGVSQAMPGPAFVAAIVDVVPTEGRSRAFNLQFWAFNIGMAGASLLAGLLAEWSYRGLFLLDATASLITAVLIIWKVPETKPAAARPTARPSLRTPLTDRVFLIFVGLTLIQALLYAQGTTILPLSMRADGLRPSAYGLVVALSGALIVLGQLFVPRLIDGRRKAHVLALALLLMGIGYASVAVADQLGVYLVAALVWTIGVMLAAPPNAEINAELAPALLRGRYQAVFYLAFPASQFLAPTLGGVGLQQLGEVHWVLTGLVAVAAAGLHLLTGPRRERRAVEMQESGAASSAR
jgi:MFS family permease